MKPAFRMATFAPGMPAVMWWPILIGLLAMYVPTYMELAGTLWEHDDYAHGPIVLVVTLYLLWRERRAILDSESQPQAGSGWALTTVGLLMYVLGRSQDILLFEVGSQILVLTGVLLVTQGIHVVRRAWFALFFLIFMLPLPGFVVDALTGPLKQYISVIAEELLYLAGYPIARNGVILTIGQYQLLVADACSGLHSMFSLSAMGLLYLYLMEYRSLTRKLIIIAAILPIAFVANIVRVMVLVLVTYYFGDEAGQGFVHGFAGIALFVIGLIFLFILDGFLGLFFDRRSKGPAT